MSAVIPILIAEQTLVELRISSVFPDPAQPRQHPDAELAESLRSVGQLLPIRVEVAESGYLIQDGERRWRGLVEAGASTVLAVIVPPATEGQRLLRQLVANSGRPLSPIEEARAYRRLLELEGWSANRLAQELGKPRSTVGDRLRVLELDAVWLDLIGAGVLQLSHVPILHRYVAVPAAGQAAAAARLPDSYQAKEAAKQQRPLTVQEAEYSIRYAYRDELASVNDVPGYTGPTVTLTDYGQRTTYAADRAQWAPLREAEEARWAAEGGVSLDGDENANDAPDWAAALPAGVRTRTTRDGDLDDEVEEVLEGEIEVLDEDRWAFSTWASSGRPPFDPRVLIAQAAPETLTVVRSEWGSTTLVTTDHATMAAARAAFNAEALQQYRTAAAPLLAQFDAAIPTAPVHGAGCLGLAAWALRAGDGMEDAIDPLDLMYLLDLAEVPAADVDRRDEASVAQIVAQLQARGTLGRFLSAIAVIPTLDAAAVPTLREIRRTLAEEYQKIQPTWPGAVSVKKKRQSKTGVPAISADVGAAA